MEFNYPAMDEQTSSDSNYFTQLGIREGYVDLGNGEFSTRTELREAILREIEKEKIRGGIIAMEIARKRALEEELRKPPQAAEECEHQLLSQRHRNKYMFPHADSAIRYKPTIQPPSAEEMIGMSLEARLGTFAAARRGLAVFDAVPFNGRGSKPPQPPFLNKKD